MRVLRAEEYRRMPWRNGGGVTAEVAIGPAGATIEDFDWRVSMALMGVDGPFSSFPGKDRTLMVLRGNGLQLSIAEGAPCDLTRDSTPFEFSGDVAAHAALLCGAVTDLNVMTDRARLQHTVRRLPVAENIELAIESPVALLVCGDADARIGVDVGQNQRSVELAALDALLIEDAPTRLRIHGSGLALGYLIEIRERRSSH
ncbi:MAG: HutD family protein [Gemmatimonadaceae bacterium]